MAKTDKFDYEKELDKFELLKAQNPALTQGEFAEALGIGQDTLSTHFAQIREVRKRKDISQKLLSIGIAGLDKVTSFLSDDKIPMETVKDYEGLSRITFGALDRSGFSPAQIQVNMNQQQGVQVNIPALFEATESQEVKKLLGEA